MREVQIDEARKRLHELVDRARLTGEPTLIMLGHTPAAVLLPASVYRDPREEWISEHETYSSDRDSDDDYEYEYRGSDPRELDPGTANPELYGTSSPRELGPGSGN